MMNKKTNTSKDGGQSFWSTLPGILTAIAAVITAVAGFIVALNAAGLFNNNRGGQPIATLTNPAPEIATSLLTQPPASTSLSSSNRANVFSGCFEQYFHGVARDRLFPLESGAGTNNLINPDQINDEPIGILFTDNGKPIGGIIFQFFSDGQIFKITSVVDAGCNNIENYSNASRASDKHILQNWDDLQIQFGNISYVLNLGYGGGIDVKFNK